MLSAELIVNRQLVVNRQSSIATLPYTPSPTLLLTGFEQIKESILQLISQHLSHKLDLCATADSILL